MRVALVTCAELPDLDVDDQPIVTLLEARGVTVSLPIWDDPTTHVDVDLTVLRNPWDYTTKHAAFIDYVTRTNNLLNPAHVVIDNADKAYLARLHERGVPTVPTVAVSRDDFSSFNDVIARLPTARGYVVKPRIGAGSRDTIKVDNDDDGQRRAHDFLVEHLPHEAFLVQPFLPSIDDGEVSLIYIDGVYSHGVIKRPKAGDFRTQPEFDADIARHTPTAAQRALADRVIADAGGDILLYARVDIVTGLDNAPAIIELELVEPSLYFAWSDSKNGAGEHFADAIVKRIKR